MSRAVVPIANVARRIPEAGRIRFGVKTAKAMKAIDTFRFTSHDQAALEQVAALYGGEVNPWNEPKAAPGQFEVITNASEIQVVLPPDPLGGSPVYELWGGGGCERRCDGVTCTVIQKGPDGAEPVEIECPCAAAGALSCEPRIRLSVMLAGVRFGGVWRLESKSWNAVHEMPGMVELIQGLQHRGLTKGVLALKHRRSVTAGQTHEYIVPVLGVSESLEEIAAGAARLGALPPADTGAPAALPEGPGSAAALPPPPSHPGDSASPDGAPAPEPSQTEVITPELVDSVPVQGAPPVDEPSRPPATPPGEPRPMTDQQSKAVHALLRTKRNAIGPNRWPVLAELCGRDIGSAKDVTLDEASMIIDTLNDEPDADKTPARG